MERQITRTDGSDSVPRSVQRKKKPMQEKKRYFPPELTVIHFPSESVLTLSFTEADTGTDWDSWLPL